ncbi:MAG: hypothetical protein M3R13_02560 [Armatimonadota bacterium]|nr:hypothetical protein [Armatimonadota bacterium]
MSNERKRFGTIERETMPGYTGGPIPAIEVMTDRFVSITAPQGTEAYRIKRFGSFVDDALGSRFVPNGDVEVFFYGHFDDGVGARAIPEWGLPTYVAWGNSGPSQTLLYKATFESG